MATYSRPGVFIQEVALPQTIPAANNGTAVGAFVGAQTGVRGNHAPSRL